MAQPVAILSLGPRTAGLAARLREHLPGSRVHAPACADCPADERFEKAVPHLQALFAAGTPIVGICAAGILVRALGPVLANKADEPPVLAVSEDRSVVVPLLGGHHGANDLARRLATAVGATAAVTTAGDTRFGLALDEPPTGWTLANPADAKSVMARLLEGQSARLTVEAGDASWLTRSDLPLSPDGAIELLVTPRAVAGSPDRLVYHPKILALGAGAERGASPDALGDLVSTTLADAGLAPAALACVASIDLKADEPALHALGYPARFFAGERLAEETDRLSTRSEIVFRETGCWGVAEGAALAATGPEGTLVVPKRVGDRVTCAVAQASTVIDPTSVGRSRGHLVVVGLGPGSADWRTAEADRLLRDADELVGYGLYLDLVGPAGEGKPRRAFPLGEEAERCRFALARAAEGRRVALVCSGDPGIYALATLVFELIEAPPDPAWARVEITVAPGVSAMQAAAARLGAPLGHDFCAISLSDLLTPWPMIATRLEAAAAGDFVVALYNPVSLRRREGLAKAREALLAQRGGATPVAVCRSLGRADEAVTVTTLQDLTVDQVDMLSIVIVGSSRTRALPRGDGTTSLFTPRGYEVR
ncbi:MAG: precorrin-3B C(17)-methyltransferase [Geminicoccaceae bacterium]